jgi:hypothetical protein
MTGADLKASSGGCLKKPFWIAIACAALGVSGQLAYAQGASNLCGTRNGICYVPWGPLGRPCGCGRDPGRLIMPPYNWNSACGTHRGVCFVDAAPIGSRCGCYGDPGRILPR